MSTYDQIKEAEYIKAYNKAYIKAKKDCVKRGHLLDISIELLAKVSGFSVEEVTVIISKKAT
jgi:hypothetical protein